MTGFNPELIRLAEDVEHEIRHIFRAIDARALNNQHKVLVALWENRISQAHFAPTTGYGYDDMGRDALDKVFACVFHTEDALVRHNFVSGTHVLAACLFGVLRPGDTLLAATGKPYDTLDEVIGIRGSNNGSLREFGVLYKQVELAGGKPDLAGILKALEAKPRVVMLQRSRGYDWRPSVTIDELSRLIAQIKAVHPTAIVMTDNCYGEFVEELEPTDVGADIAAGSLIKNPGGGIAQSGGYVAGKSALIEQISYRMTAPGIGRECGASLGFNRSMYHGLFHAPHVVAQSLKTAVFCSRIMERLGYEVSPAYDQPRTDIIEAIKFGAPDKLIRFCQGIQAGSPVDSFVTPQPWSMPGYESEVIMAAGAFVEGSSIELSADAPLRPPYIAYLQGGLTYEAGKLGVLTALNFLN